MTKRKIGRNDPCPCGSGLKYKYCCMVPERRQLPNGVYPKDIPHYVGWLIDLLGRHFVDEMVDEFTQLEAVRLRDPFKYLTLDPPHALAPGLAAYVSWQKSFLVDRQEPVPLPLMWLTSQAFNLHLVSVKLDPAIKREAVRSKLCAADQIGGLLFEFKIAAHYAMTKHRVHMPELSGTDNIDVLVYARRTAVEIQCKRKKLGFGRKVPDPVFDKLVGFVGQALGDQAGHHGITLECRDRLDDSDLEQLAERIATAVRNAPTAEQSILQGRYYLTIESLGEPSIRIPARQALQRIGGFYTDPTHPPHLALTWYPPAVINPEEPVSPGFFCCQSRQKDRVVRRIMDSLKEGAKQLSGARPGVVAVHHPVPATQDDLEPWAAGGPGTFSHRLWSHFKDPDSSLHRVAAVTLSAEHALTYHRGVFYTDLPAIVWRNPVAEHQLPSGFSPARLRREGKVGDRPTLLP